MAEFKLCISDPKSGKSYSKEVKEAQADSLVNRKLGEKVAGDSLGLAGYEFEITGGSDNAGFPMRRGIHGILRKKIFTGKGVGFRSRNRWKYKDNSLRRKKTVMGSKISNTVSLVNLKVLKAGAESLEPKKEEPAVEGAKKEE